MADYIYLNPEYSELPGNLRLVDLERLLSWREGEIVGEHGPRMVWRTKLDGREGGSGIFYIRQEHKIPLAEVASDLCRFRNPASRALKTLRATELLFDAGIKTAPIVGLIERRFLDIPIKAVAIQGHVNGKSLYHQLLIFGRLIHRKTNPLARTKLLYELGNFLAKLHRAKISWPDLVSKHIYLQYGEYKSSDEPWWKFAVIDIERIESGLNLQRRNRQLDRFLLSLRGLLSSTDLVRMSHGYLGLSKISPRPVRRTLLEKFFPDGNRWLERARDELTLLKSFPDDQLLPEEEIYERIGTLVFNQRFKELLLETGLLEPQVIFKFRRGSELYKKGLGRRFRMRFETIKDNRRIWLYLKRLHHPRIFDQIRRMLSGTIRHSSCWHERYMIKQLGICRIPAPVIVAYAEKMFFCYEIRSALITRGIVGQSLEKFIVKVFSRAPHGEDLRRRRNWVRKLACLIERFHRCGFCHRDLYFSHIFISFKTNGEPVFSLIDLARCFKPRWRKERWRVKDLAGLNYSAPEIAITKTDRLRFFKTYLGKDKLDLRDKEFVYKIIRKTRRISMHDSKHRAVTSQREL